MLNIGLGCNKFYVYHVAVDITLKRKINCILIFSLWLNIGQICNRSNNNNRIFTYAQIITAVTALTVFLHDAEYRQCGNIFLFENAFLTIILPSNE